MGTEFSKQDNISIGKPKPSKENPTEHSVIATNKKTKTSYRCLTIPMSDYVMQKYNDMKQDSFQGLKSPFIEPILGHLITPEAIHLFVPLQKGESLRLYLERRQSTGADNYIPERRLISIFLQICLGINHLHKYGILHRNIQTDSITTDENGSFRLSQLTSVTELEDEKNTSTAIGDIATFSPERLNGTPYSFAADIYSLGIVAYELCTFRKPYTSVQQLIHKQPIPPIPSTYSLELANIITRTLSHNPNERPSIDEILSVPLFRSNLKTFIWNAIDNVKDSSPDNLTSFFYFNPIQTDLVQVSKRTISARKPLLQPTIVFLDPLLTDGIFSCTFTFHTKSPNPDTEEFAVGIIDSQVDISPEFSLTTHTSLALISSRDIFIFNNKLTANNGAPWSSSDTITLVSDLRPQCRTLHFLHNHNPLPFHMIRIPVSIRLFISLTSNTQQATVSALGKISPDEMRWMLERWKGVAPHKNATLDWEDPESLSDHRGIPPTME
ncbi:putative CAMK family protein kinase [Blattamonas nauphoetae]|uniref:non-specific serine/threonine protein kinase n=1 Tax=Blattamonas nauphoetae TaxID=2049346 RepID=A0ABQ9XPI2_9EUKA|nr:putative CAMK family protein kinase [Blattamonas nauphoetae]